MHECKKDRDEHLLQIITEAQTNSDAIDPILLPPHRIHDDEDGMDDNNEGLSELLDNIDEYTTAAINANKRTTEEQYIQETIEVVKKVGRFNDVNSKLQILAMSGGFLK